MFSMSHWKRNTNFVSMGHFSRCFSWSCRFLECSTLEHRSKVKNSMWHNKCLLYKCLHLFRLTFSEWPLVFVMNTHTWRNRFSSNTSFYGCHPMIAADTHWYCKCVVMIDIFLRLYNNRGTREGVEIVEIMSLKYFLFANSHLQSAELHPLESPYFLLLDQEAGRGDKW